MGDLAKRVLTAGVLVPILLVALFVDPTCWSIVVIAALVAGLAYDEFLRMSLGAELSRGLRWLSYSLAIATVVLPSLTSLGIALPPLMLFAVLLVGLSVMLRSSQLPQAGPQMAAFLSGLLYIPVLMAVMPLLKRDLGDEGPGWLLIALGMAFLSDTAAYFAGRAFGKHKLYAKVSPKKTWEGAVGGVFGGMVSAVVLGSLWLVPSLPIVHGLILGALGSIAGQIGDLVESMIKRSYGAKDSGTLLPGHGGMLDRIDGMLFVGPVVHAYVLIAPLFRGL